MKNNKTALNFLSFFLIISSLAGAGFAQSSYNTIFYDNFSSNSKDWPVKNNANVTLEIRNGYYYFTHHNKTKGWSAHKQIRIVESRDFIIETKIKKISGIQDNGFGLIWGRKDTDNQFAFIISGNGYFKIKKERFGKETLFQDWKTHSAINQGNGALNTLKISKSYGKVYFYINGRLVHSMSSQKFPGERVGFVVYNNQSIAIDYLSVKQKGSASFLSQTGGSEKSLFYDSFTSNAKGWSMTSSAKASFDIRNGYYYFTHKRKSGGWTSTNKVVIDQNKDFVIEAKFKKISGIQNNGYGITWGRKDSGNEFNFIISGSGYFKILKDTFGKETLLKDWKTSGAISQGNGQTNTLKISKSYGKLYFYINNQQVHSMYFQKFMGDLLGFVIYDNQGIAVDYLSVKQKGGTALAGKKKKKQSANTVFYDSFISNSNNWSVSSSADAAFSLSGGYYYCSHLRDTKGYTSSIASKFDSYRDFMIETKIKKISGILNNGYGIVWGRKNSDNEFEFFLSGDGYFQIKKMAGGKKEAIKPWQKSSAIKTGNGAVNILKIEKRNDYYTFYINDRNVYSTGFEPFFGDRIGFVVYQRQKIAVDYLKIAYLKGASFNAAPLIVISEPSLQRGMKKVSQKNIRVSGTVTDSDGIYKVTVNGYRATVQSSGSFWLDLPLSTGKNKIKVVATDNKMKSATKTFSITREAPYVQKPVYTGAEKRLALVIGNARYKHGGSLDNPVNDARSMKSVLQDLGFRVIEKENCTQRDIKKAIDEFGRKLNGYDVALFFYAGHGIQVNGNNYLVPVDALLENENDVEYDAVRADRVLAKMESAGSKTNIVILDACRDNPFERSWRRGTRGKGLAFMNAPSGSLIAYATSPGNTASDGRGDNGLYTSALLKHIRTPDITIEQLFKRVRSTIMDWSNEEQIPWESTSLRGDFYFKK